MQRISHQQVLTSLTFNTHNAPKPAVEFFDLGVEEKFLRFERAQLVVLFVVGHGTQKLFFIICIGILIGSKNYERQY